MKHLFESIVFEMIAFLFRATGKMLSLEQGRRIGSFLGRISCRIDKRHRNIALENLARAFPLMTEAQLRDMTVRVFGNLGKILFEMAWFLSLDGEKLFRRFRFEGLEHLRSACDEGKGVLALTAHFGNWELLSVVGAIIKQPVIHTIYRPLDFRPLDRFVVGCRSRFGSVQIPRKKTFRRVLRATGNGEIVVLLMDQNVACREGVFADFFGHPACTSRGMAQLALKTGAAVVPVFLIREEKGFFIKISPPLPRVHTGDTIHDLEANTALYNQTIEEMVRRYPDQWFWVHRRWNSRPFYPWPRQAE